MMEGWTVDSGHWSAGQGRPFGMAVDLGHGSRPRVGPVVTILVGNSVTQLSHVLEPQTEAAAAGRCIDGEVSFRWRRR